jgi:potassium efflux system protein
LTLLGAALAFGATPPVGAQESPAIAAAAAAELTFEAALEGAPLGVVEAAAVDQPRDAGADLAPAEQALAGPEHDPADDHAGDAGRPSEARVLAPPDPAERKTLEARLAALPSSGLGADDQKKAGDFYRQALASFDVAMQQIETAQKLEAELERTRSGDQSTAATTAKLARPLPPYEDVAGESLVELEKRAQTVETALAGYREDLAAMNAEPMRRSQRMAELPRQIAETQQKLKQAAEDLAALGSEDPSDVVAAAHRAALSWSQQELRATLAAFDREQTLYQQTADWVTVRRDYFARYVPHKEKRLAQLRTMITRLREQETQEQVRLAAAAVAEAAKVNRPKQIIKLANANKHLADERTAIVAAMTAASREADATRAANTQLKAQQRSAQQRAEKLSKAAGQLLRDQQAKLPNVRQLQREYAAREPLLSEVLLRIYALQDESAELANLDDVADQLAADAGDQSPRTRAEIRCLLVTKRETLEQLIKDYTTYSTDLNALHSAQAELIALVDEYADFIAERVLWIRSCAPPSASDVRHAAHALAWSLDVQNWRDAGHAFLSASAHRPVQFAGFLLAIVALVAVQKPARRQLRDTGAEAKKRNCTRLQPTLQALGLTALLALPWPAVLAVAGWTMDGWSQSDFVHALGVALRFVAVCVLLVELARHLCRQDGLGDAHFDWSGKCLHHVRRKLRWLAALGLPPVLWLVGLEVQTAEPFWSSSLGRALFVGVMLLLAVVFHRILLAANSPFRQIVFIREGWLAPLRVVWRPAIVFVPAALALLAAVGYYYTAQQAALRVLQTVGLLIAVPTLGGVTRRWLLVSRRRLAREQAKQRRAQLAAGFDDDPASLNAAELVDEAVDLAALSEQTQKLVRTFLTLTLAVGIVLIWGEILPALKYPAKHLLPGATTLTWGHLATFLLVLAVTYISVRDVPALLNLVILQHLPLDSGARYAFTSLSRYVLAAIGLTAAFNAVEGEWAKIQWLVAAMSVGLGFGLQEIFANFVSGIILLFERPIRVGDVVTLGDKTGVVNRIRMRATTIVDPDRKEYIVPNKDLVTERLLNWTLTDFTNRIEIVILVADGSDTDLACKLLLEAAREQPHVLTEPSPSATFEGFVDTGRKLVLRCFLPTLENRGSTIHALHSAIDRKLRAAGIENAYGDLRVRVAREGARARAEESAPLAFPGPLDRQGAA